MTEEIIKKIDEAIKLLTEAKQAILKGYTALSAIIKLVVPLIPKPEPVKEDSKATAPMAKPDSRSPPIKAPTPPKKPL